MLKKYVARSQVNLNVTFPGGSYIHLTFVPKTGGGSEFYTCDEALQEALEKHNYFGRLFRLEKTVDPEKEAPKPKPVEKKEVDKNRLEFRNYDDAKEYFADRFGISRSRLRSRAAIEEAAVKNGIEIVWAS